MPGRRRSRQPIDPRLHHTEESLRRLWVEQLHDEYDLINHWYTLKLRPPVLRVERLPGRWGEWDAGTRTLTISAALIERYRWDVVIEVLKHEMAHQLVSEGGTGASQGARPVGAAAGGARPRPHGPEFMAACERVRVAEWARSASGELPTELPEDPAAERVRALGEEEERLLKRAEKLLSLARSSNEHEALLAMQRVQELYARHNLERLRARREAAVVTLTLHLRRRRLSRVDSMILAILSEHFFVRIIHGRLYDARDCCDYATCDLIGTRPNVLMAEYVHGFLQRQVETLWEAHRARTGVRPAARLDYQLGVLSGFQAKLTESRDQVTATAMGVPPSGTSKNALVPVLSEAQALVARGEREIEDYIRYHYPRLRTTRWSAGYRDPGSFSAGQADGRRIVLHHSVTEERGNRQRLLPR